MADDTSEEKTLPASDKKVRDAREKGQVLRSQDLVTGIVVLACTLYVALMLDNIIGKVQELLFLVSEIYVNNFDTVWPRIQSVVVAIFLLTMLPAFLMVVVAVIGTNGIVMNGFIFSAEPVKPKFEHINPVEGVKRIFSVRSITELIKAVIKLLILGAAFVIVFRIGLQSLMESAYCGLGCVYASFVWLIIPLVITSLLLFMAVGMVDVLIQQWLFKRELRMTISEQKRETKDMDGDPLVKRERNRLRKELMAGEARKIGLQHASFILSDPIGRVVGIRYVKGQTPAPVIVTKSEGSGLEEAMEKARQLNLPLVVDEELTRQVSRRSAGDGIPENTYQNVADIMVKTGIL